VPGPFYHVTSGCVPGLNHSNASDFSLSHNNRILCSRTLNRRTQTVRGSTVPIPPSDRRLRFIWTLALGSLSLSSSNIYRSTIPLNHVDFFHTSLPYPMVWIQTTLHNFTKIFICSWKTSRSSNSRIS
jgi:hypothetical protein